MSENVESVVAGGQDKKKKKKKRAGESLRGDRLAASNKNEMNQKQPGTDHGHRTVVLVCPVLRVNVTLELGQKPGLTTKTARVFCTEIARWCCVFCAICAFFCCAVYPVPFRSVSTTETCVCVSNVLAGS